MKRARRVHPPEFKAKVVWEVLSDPNKLQEIARKYDLNPNQIKNWKSQLKKSMHVVFIDRRGTRS